MTRDELLALPGKNNPTLLADGSMGMLLVYPPDPETTLSISTLCGVQVHGEEEMRMIDVAILEATSLGALRQIGAPKLPNRGSPSDIIHMLLAMQWSELGREWILEILEPEPEKPLSSLSVNDICAMMLACGMSNDKSDRAFAKECALELAKRKPANDNLPSKTA